jgi:hypothetical protein
MQIQRFQKPSGKMGTQKMWITSNVRTCVVRRPSSQDKQ